MNTYTITVKSSGVSIGAFEGDDEDDAVETMAQDAGYESFEAMCGISDPKDLDAEVYKQRNDLLVTPAWSHIEVVANGDLDGDGVVMSMGTYHDIIRTELEKRYPGLRISITGDENTYGGDSAYLLANDGSDQEDIHDVMQEIYGVACESEGWEVREEEA